MNKRRRIRLKPIPRLIFYIISIVVLFSFCEKRINQLPGEYLQINANNFAQNSINKVLENKFSNIETAYDILYDEKDLNLIEVNSNQVNMIKSELTQQINKALNGNKFSFIPIGNLMNYSLLSGYGFKVPINMYYHGNCDVKLLSEFSSSGINQTRYNLTAMITAEVSTASLTNNASSTVNIEYLLCEIVFAGEIPNYKRYF